jgi:aminomuconate-semialdehyde/2-hydroxymuconate-6-semialdehyde dehydrogenase
MKILVLNRQRLADMDYPGLLGPRAEVVVVTAPSAIDAEADLRCYAEVVVMDDFAESPLVERRLIELHQRHLFDGIVALAERDVLRAARLRQKLGIAGQTVDSAIAYRDKLVMKQALAEAGMNLAAFAAVDSVGSLFDFAERVGFPIVVKPRTEAGSVGVHILRSAAELDVYVQAEPALRSDVDAQLLAEAYVEHDLFLIDGIAVDGKLAWFWPSAMSSMMGHLTGEPLTSQVLAADDPLVAPLRGLAEEAVAALPPLDLSLIHAEVFRTPDGQLVFNEIASRLGGAKIGTMLAHAFGIGHVQAYLRGVGEPDSLSLPPGVPQQLAGFAMIRPTPGRLVSIPQDCPLPGVVEYRRIAEAGSIIAPAVSGVTSVASIVTVGGEPAEVADRIRAAVRWFDAATVIEPNLLPRTPKLVDDVRAVRHLIGGHLVDAGSGETFETRDPHDDTLLGTVARGTAADAQAAITAARTAFDEGPWPWMSPKERQKILHAVADAVDSHRDELAMLETRDAGKIIRQSLHGEMPRVAHNLRFFADYAAMAADEAYPDGGLLSYTLHPPAGVVSAISPWNAPLMLATWKLAPALAFGNTAILKPAPQTPLTAARFGELALAAGLPEGVLNVVHGFGGDEVAGPLTSDARVDRITFPGSSATGRAIMAAAAANLTPVSAELGGKSANIVFADADLDVAVPESIKAAFAGNGQVCFAGTRLFVQREILPEFLERFVAAAKRIVIGDPKSFLTDMGPLIEQRHLDKVHRYVELAGREGGEIVLGGARLDSVACAGGFYYPPTVVTGLRNDSRTAQEEIFGPVETVIPFDTEDEVIRLANSTAYGLSGILFTRNLDRAHRLAARWKAGTVWINTYFERDLRLPFGGEGISGVGREGGQHSREFFTEPRAVMIRIR